MIFKSTFTKIVVMGIIIFPFFGSAYADFPQTTVGVIDINYILADKGSGFSLDKKLNTVPVDYVSKIISETTFDNNKELSEPKNKTLSNNKNSNTQLINWKRTSRHN